LQESGEYWYKFVSLEEFNDTTEEQEKKVISMFDYYIIFVRYKLLIHNIKFNYIYGIDWREARRGGLSLADGEEITALCIFSSLSHVPLSHLLRQRPDHLYAVGQKLFLPAGAAWEPLSVAPQYLCPSCD